MAAVNSPLALLLSLFLLFWPPVYACDARDEEALFKIKAGFSNHRMFSSWTNSTDCCRWEGVSCGHSWSDRISSLSFYNSGESLDGLSGPLPPSLGDLPFLSLVLIDNHPNIVGGLPTSLTRLKYLIFLGIHHTSLSGSIPLFLSQIRSLKLLDLSFNKFSGTIPSELSSLPNLNALYLEGNDLVGRIPPAFGSFPMSSPPSLYLSHNRLSGDIPPEFGMPDWVSLDLSHNNLSGDAKVLLGASKALRSLDLSFNSFEFDLSPISFPVNMTDLFLNDNIITGSIPAQINQLSGLTKFNVSNNKLCGLIPAGPVMDKFDAQHFFGNKCLCTSQHSCF